MNNPYPNFVYDTVPILKSLEGKIKREEKRLERCESTGIKTSYKQFLEGKIKGYREVTIMIRKGIV